MILFLDSSVLVAASASPQGASRVLFNLSKRNEWILMSIPYVQEEVERNLKKFAPVASQDWEQLKPQVMQNRDVLTIPRPVVFGVTKDRPILLSALAYADVLITLDRADFMDLLGQQFYGLPILRPSDFLERERHRGAMVE